MSIPHDGMSREQLALWLAGNIKAAMITRSSAITYYRNYHGTTFMEALTAIDIAIGEWNEGKRYNNAREEIYV